MSSGGVLLVSSGEDVQSSTVASGGTETLLSGGIAGLQRIYGGSCGAAVSSGGTLVVSSGGLAIDALVGSGGTQIVLAGGTAYEDGDNTVNTVGAISFSGGSLVLGG